MAFSCLKVNYGYEVKTNVYFFILSESPYFRKTYS